MMSADWDTRDIHFPKTIFQADSLVMSMRSMVFSLISDLIALMALRGWRTQVARLIQTKIVVDMSFPVLSYDDASDWPKMRRASVTWMAMKRMTKVVPLSPCLSSLTSMGESLSENFEVSVTRGWMIDSSDITVV